MKRLTRSRGVAMVMALALLGIVAVVLGAVAVRTNLEMQRTFSTADDAQATQLLVAGAQAARAQSASGQRVDGAIATPLGEVKLTWASAGAGKCTIDARLPHLARSIDVDVVAAP